tara:strand:- start:377 stop:697 length:321 start_codon:yes stop_codon:yes gene_type:complete
MRIPEIINQMELELQDLEESLYSHPYAASPSDYEIVNGEQIYTDEYMENMPIEYNTMLTRFGTLFELKQQLEESQIQNGLKKDLDNYLKENYSPKHHKRWDITFDE